MSGPRLAVLLAAALVASAVTAGCSQPSTSAEGAHYYSLVVPTRPSTGTADAIVDVPLDSARLPRDLSRVPRLGSLLASGVAAALVGDDATAAEFGDNDRIVAIARVYAASTTATGAELYAWLSDGGVERGSRGSPASGSSAPIRIRLASEGGWRVVALDFPDDGETNAQGIRELFPGGSIDAAQYGQAPSVRADRARVEGILRGLPERPEL